MGQQLVIVSSPLVGCVSITPFRLSSVALCCLYLRVGFSYSSGSVGVLLLDPVVPSLKETFEVPMRVGSSSSLLGLSSD